MRNERAISSTTTGKTVNFAERISARTAKLIAGLQDDQDRARLIVLAGHMDALLEEILRSYFVACPNASDPLFDGPGSSIATFSSRIEFAHRLGIISARMAKSLHLVRKVRNECAHSLEPRSFDSPEIASRIKELLKLVVVLPQLEQEMAKLGTDYKVRFAAVMICMIAALEQVAMTSNHQPEAPLEFLFTGNSP